MAIVFTFFFSKTLFIMVVKIKVLFGEMFTNYLVFFAKLMQFFCVKKPLL
jgi:hypothetical protein